MLKYANVQGFETLGEIKSHYYGWKKAGYFLIVKAYICEPIAFYGKIDNEEKSYTIKEINIDLLTELRDCVGEIEFITNLEVFDSSFIDYNRAKVETNG